MNGEVGSTPPAPPLLTVTHAEAGQKLLQFLERRMHVPGPGLHRWIRTGQVRVNSKRAKAFDRLHMGDVVRLPPFAFSQARAVHDTPVPEALPMPFVPVLVESDAVLICCKPAGLPVHAGTGHADSLAARLHAHYAGSAFMPTPAHRLDKATSGLLLIAKTYAALRLIQEALGDADRLTKTYLAWVGGNWPHDHPVVLRDHLHKATSPDGLERMHTTHADGALALLTARRIATRQHASLLQIDLHTGRTHQIRAQLAARGHPLIGDPKYGGPACPQGMLLHAWGLSMSPDLAAQLGLAATRVFAPPSWQAPWQIEHISIPV